MAKKKRAVKLSVGEMRLMSILWRSGPLKLSEVYHEQPGQVGYTTIQTQLNRLVEKGVAARSRARPTKYKALVEPEAASAAMLELLIDTVGGGSILPLVEQLIRRSPLSKDEIRDLKQLIGGTSVTPRPTKRRAKASKAK